MKLTKVQLAALQAHLDGTDEELDPKLCAELIGRGLLGYRTERQVVSGFPVQIHTRVITKAGRDALKESEGK